MKLPYSLRANSAASQPRLTIGVTVFQSGKGTTITMTLSVIGEEEVKVPAGTFATWKVEMAGGEQPSTLYVEKAAPHRLVKLAIAGAPVELVRIR